MVVLFHLEWNGADSRDDEEAAEEDDGESGGGTEGHDTESVFGSNAPSVADLADVVAEEDMVEYSPQRDAEAIEA